MAHIYMHEEEVWENGLLFFAGAFNDLDKGDGL